MFFFEQPSCWPLDKQNVHPRPILKSTTYLLTRKTTQGQFLLRPSKEVNACIRYCLAMAQRRSKVEVHCVVFLSNHYHLAVTDKHGTLPEFTEELNKLTARALNCHHGRWENFWSSGDRTSHVRLEEDSDVLDKIVYALANPTAAGLVSHGPDWPGVRLYCEGRYKAVKPKFFFRQEEAGGQLPDTAYLTLTPPPIGAPPQGSDAVIKAAVKMEEKQLRLEAERSHKKFLGAAKVKSQSVNSSPKAPAPRRGLSPRVACRDKWRRIERLARLKAFTVEHKLCRLKYSAGETEVVFPAGTYFFVKTMGARSAEE